MGRDPQDQLEGGGNLLVAGGPNTTKYGVVPVRMHTNSQALSKNPRVVTRKLRLQTAPLGAAWKKKKKRQRMWMWDWERELDLN